MEILQAAVQPATIFYTLLLAMVLIYWLSIMVGLADTSALDFEIDMDFDLDTDLDIDTEAEVGSGGGWFAGVLHFFNFGKLPFMVVASFVILFQWSLSILATIYVEDYSIFFALAIAIPILFVSLLLTKFISSPLIPVFANLDPTETPIDFIGETGTIVISPTSEKLGQAEVILDGSLHMIYVKTAVGKDIARKQDTVVITKKHKELDYFEVELLQS